MVICASCHYAFCSLGCSGLKPSNPKALQSSVVLLNKRSGRCANFIRGQDNLRRGALSCLSAFPPQPSRFGALACSTRGVLQSHDYDKGAGSSAANRFPKTPIPRPRTETKPSLGLNPNIWVLRHKIRFVHAFGAIVSED